MERRLTAVGRESIGFVVGGSDEVRCGKEKCIRESWIEETRALGGQHMLISEQATYIK
jgi:hypothetical protein